MQLPTTEEKCPFLNTVIFSFHFDLCFYDFVLFSKETGCITPDFLFLLCVHYLQEI